MNVQHTESPDKKFLFTIDVYMKGTSIEQSEETLRRLLNTNSITDYQIKKNKEIITGIEQELDMAAMVQQMVKEKKLIRLSVVKGLGIHLSIPCRLINFDSASQNVIVYHVDEKKVYTFKLNEIEDFQTT